MTITSTLCKSPNFKETGIAGTNKTKVTEPLFNPKAQAEDFVQLSESRVLMPTNDIEAEAVKLMQENANKPRCGSMAYNLNASSEAKRIPEDSVSLAYGSASMQGYLF